MKQEYNKRTIRMNKEITMWSIMADIQESGDILSVIEGLKITLMLGLGLIIVNWDIK